MVSGISLGQLSGSMFTSLSASVRRNGREWAHARTGKERPSTCMGPAPLLKATRYVPSIWVVVGPVASPFEEETRNQDEAQQDGQKATRAHPPIVPPALSRFSPHPEGSSSVSLVDPPRRSTGECSVPGKRNESSSCLAHGRPCSVICRLPRQTRTVSVSETC